MHSCLTLGNELSEDAHVLTKQETLLRRGALAESSRLRKSWRLLCHVGHSLRFYGDEISFWVVSGRSF